MNDPCIEAKCWPETCPHRCPVCEAREHCDEHGYDSRRNAARRAEDEAIRASNARSSAFFREREHLTWDARP